MGMAVGRLVFVQGAPNCKFKVSLKEMQRTKPGPKCSAVCKVIFLPSKVCVIDTIIHRRSFFILGKTHIDDRALGPRQHGRYLARHLAVMAVLRSVYLIFLILPYFNSPTLFQKFISRPSFWRRKLRVSFCQCPRAWLCGILI